MSPWMLVGWQGMEPMVGFWTRIRNCSEGGCEDGGRDGGGGSEGLSMVSHK